MALTWLRKEASVSGHVGLSMGPLQYPCDMIAGFVQSEWCSRSSKVEIILSFMKQPWRSHIPSLRNLVFRVSYELWPALKGRDIELYLLREDCERISGYVLKPHMIILFSLGMRMLGKFHYDLF